MDVAEIERKFDAPSDVLLPPLRSGNYAAAREFTLRAVYFDTPDFVLLRSGRGTLRRREGGYDEGWHVKLAVSAGERLEVHAPLGPLIPDELRARVTEIVGNAPLIPVATLVTRRAETDVLGPDGTVLGLVCRDDVTAEAGDTVTRWSEVEVEVVSAGRAWLDQVTADFEAAGVHPSASASKYAMAVAPLADAPVPPPSAGSVVLDYIRIQVGTIQSYAAGVRDQADDAAHKSRVATRRLRSVLRTFAPLFGPVPGLRRELRWHAESLGAERDAEVLQETLSQRVAQVPAADLRGPIVERLSSSLALMRAEAHEDLLRSMSTQRYAALRRALTCLSAAPPLTPRAADEPAALIDLARRASRRTAAAAAAAEEDPDNLAAWHEVRKLAKAARYANEAMAPAIGDTAVEAAARWEGVTEVFGRVQDTLVGREQLQELAHDASRVGEPTETYELLIRAEEEAGVLALAEGREVLADALVPMISMS